MIRIAERFGCRATGVNITPFQVTARKPGDALSAEHTPVEPTP
ncbi:hypothetical protein ABZ281_21375 [Streptomyces sp. NPDC006265]